MDPWRGRRSYYHEWYRYRSRSYDESQFSSYRPPSSEQYPHDYRIYEEELRRRGLEDDRVYEEELRRRGLEDDRVYEEELRRRGPEDDRIYEEELRRRGLEDDRVYEELRRRGLEDDRVYEEELHRRRLEDDQIYEERLLYRSATEADRYYNDDVPPGTEQYPQDYRVYDELRRQGPDDVQVYEERLLYRRGPEDDGYYNDDLEVPGLSRYYHEEFRSFGSRSYPHDRVEGSSYSTRHHDNVEDPRVEGSSYSTRHHDNIEDPSYRTYHQDNIKDPGYSIHRNDSAEDPACSRYQHDTSKASVVSRYHHEDFDRQRFQRSQSSPVSAPVTWSGQRIRNLPADRTKDARPIPTIHGQGFNRSPSKKWYGQHASPQSANKIINSLSTIPGKQIVRPSVPISQQLGSQLKRVAMPSATASFGSRPQGNQLSTPSLATLEGNQLPNVRTTITSVSQQSKTESERCQQSTPQSANPLTKLSGQSCLKSSGNLLPTGMPSAFSSPQSTSTGESVNSSLPGSVHQIETLSDDKLIEQERKAGRKSDSVLNNIEEKQDRPKVLVEVELIKKLEGIELGTKHKERMQIEDLLVEEIDSKTAPHEDIDQDKCVSEVENDKKNVNNDKKNVNNDKKNVNNDGVNIVVPTVEHSSNTVKNGSDVSCYERAEVIVHKESLALNEDVNDNSEKVIIYNIQNQGAKTEKGIAVDKDMLQKRTNNETEACTTDGHGHILGGKSSSTETIKSSVVATKLETEVIATENVLTVGVNEIELNFSEGKEDVKNIKEGEPDVIIKPSDVCNKDAKFVENGESAIDNLTTDRKIKEDRLNSISDLHKRVLEKISSKTSLVKKVNDHSLRLLENSKILNSSERFIELAIDDNLMEVDESFNSYSDTDSCELNANKSSKIKNTVCAEEDDKVEREMYNISFDQSLTEVDEKSFDESLPCMNETDMEDTSLECRLDNSESSEVTEQNSAVEENIEMMSEYTDCSTNIAGEESETDFGNVECSDISTHTSANVEIGIKDGPNRDSLNIGDAKLENVDALGIFDVDQFGGVATNNMVDVNFDSNDTNNIDAAVNLESRNTRTVDARLEDMDTDNVLSNVKLGCKHSLNVDAAVKLENRDNDSTLGNKDNHDMVDEDDHFEAVEIFENEALTANEGLKDSELRKNYNIKEAFVSLGKIDDKEVEVDEQQSKVKDQLSEVGDQYIEVDDQQCTIDEQQSELNNQPSELSGVDDQETQNDQGSKLEDQQKETEGKKEESAHLLDKKSEETADIAANMMPSPVRDVDQSRHQEKAAITPNRGQRQVIPLSERFGQLDYRPDITETEEGTDVTVYKAEFENIVNTLNKRSGLKDQSGSKTELEDMDVSETKCDDIANESERANKKDMETNSSVKSMEEVGGKNEVGNIANPIPTSSSKDVKERTQLSAVKKDPKPYITSPSSPVSFLDYSDESDDELLVTPSAFLRSVEEINGRPVVITPTKVMDSSQNSTATTSSSDLSPLKPVPQRPGLKNKFTLDGLLADHEEKADLVREMDEIDQELQDEIRQGGFVNILNKEDAAAADSQITEEQKEMLKQYEVEESRICEDRPGVLVFEPQHYQCLFTSMLRPTDCGFTVGSNGLSLEKHLESLTPAQCKRVISSGIISQCFTKISCQTPLMRWLFFIMSVHDDYQVQQGCKKILLEILHFQHIYRLQKWAPRLVDVLSVLVNYGAALESLIPCGSSTLEIISGKLIHEPDYIHQPVPQNAGMNTENLILVLQILAQCLHGPSGRYSPNDLSLLCVALCKASLDTSLKNLCAKGAFQNCITMVIRQYLEADWLKERLKLTRMLVSITDHHHNSAHIAELFPPGARGMFLQRRFCYLVLSEILLDKTNVSDEVLNSIQIKDLERFIPKIKELLENDSYKLSSVVTLIDLCVGVHMTLNSEQREQLKCLLEQVRRVRVRDNVSMLDRTRVKDMIVRMTSKWALDIQTMKGKQTKIFEYASPVKMHIERVHALQSSGEEEEEHSDSDNDLPCKIQKLSPDLNT